MQRKNSVLNLLSEKYDKETDIAHKNIHFCLAYLNHTVSGFIMCVISCFSLTLLALLADSSC